MDFRSALVCASSADPETRRNGDETLRSWEGQAGFYSNLWALIDQEADVKLKTLGLLYFKNGIDKYWRRNSRNGYVYSLEMISKDIRGGKATVATSHHAIFRNSGC
jgi:Importin-beta N-terminal domain